MKFFTTLIIISLIDGHTRFLGVLCSHRFNNDDVLYQVLLKAPNQNGTVLPCAGSIIAPNLVLTAGHCVHHLVTNLTAIKMFTSPVTSDKDDALHPIKVIVHPNLVYVNSSYPFSNDIAILKMAQAFKEDNSQVELQTKSLPSGTLCKAFGWEETQTGQILSIKMLEMRIKDRIQCLRSRCSMTGSGVVNGTICVRGVQNNKNHTCRGDSAGQLVCNDKLAGVVSLAEQNCMSKHPSNYVSIDYHFPWIDHIISTEYKNITNFTNFQNFTNEFMPKNAEELGKNLVEECKNLKEIKTRLFNSPNFYDVFSFVTMILIFVIIIICLTICIYKYKDRIKLRCKRRSAPTEAEQEENEAL